LNPLSNPFGEEYVRFAATVSVGKNADDLETQAPVEWRWMFATGRRNH
jgi:hypothetical protein